MPNAEPNGTDYLLKAYEYCDAWQELQDDPSESEVDIFEKSPIYQQMIEDINNRLDINLTINEIQDIYDLCRYELAWYIHLPSAWCSVFDPEHIEILEYAEDLRYYYKSGYGNEEINSRVTCDIMADFLWRLDGNDPRNVAYFSHSTTLQLLLVSLGVFRDSEHLTAANFEKFRLNREWNSSVIGPFSTNLAIIRYELVIL